MWLSEQERAEYLKNLIRQHGLDVDQFLNGEFDAYAVHSSSTIITANEALARLTGYALQEFTGLNAWRLFAPESASLIKQKLMERSEEPYVAIVRRKDGSTTPVELQGINLELAGEPIRIVLVRQLSNG